MREPPLILHGNVGPVTGSIHHGGDVRILGSVGAGFSVVATGNLVVTRDVRDATLLSGGDITVNGVVTGARAVLDALGSVRVRQAADARILAGTDVEILIATERCDVSAGRRIQVTGRPGLARGGIYRAGAGFECFRIEPAGGQIPEVTVGRPPFGEEPALLLDRIRFTTERQEQVRRRPADGARDYLRRVADLQSYRLLAESLTRRLRQAEAAEVATEDAWFRVAGTGPVRARLNLGPVEDALRGRAEKWTGSVSLVLRHGVAHASPIREATRVG